MEYIMTEDGHIKADESGKPLVLQGDKELPIDAIHLYTRVPSLQEEARKHREAKDALQAEFESFSGRYKGIDVPEAALNAMATVANLGDKDKTDAKEVEALKRQLSESHENEKKNILKTAADKEQDYINQLDTAKTRIFNLMVNNQFANSKFLAEKTMMTPSVAALVFNKNFKVEEVNGELKPVAYFENNEKIFSRDRPGDVADFDEAVGLLWNQYPEKHKYETTNPGGPNSSGNLNSVKGGAYQITKADAKDPFKYRAAKAAAEKQGLTLVTI